MLKNAKRTHGGGTLRGENASQPTVLQGWVHAYRDLGGVVFLTLRDRTGLCQVTVDERSSKALREQAGRLRQEYVVEIEGIIHERIKPNRKMPTGMVEIVPSRIELLSPTHRSSFTSPWAVHADKPATSRFTRERLCACAAYSLESWSNTQDKTKSGSALIQTGTITSLQRKPLNMALLTA